jgi:pimeloyl-ACP methyl ester carboxylesterase
MTRHDSAHTHLRRIEHPSWLPKTIWPFATVGVDTDDCVIAVSEVGQGPVLLFVHVGTWSLIWREVAIRLAPDFRCIFFDAPGTGLSRDRIEGSAKMDRASRATAAVIDALNLKEFMLVIHDLGGPAALAALGTTHERVRGIVAMNSLGWRPSGLLLRSMLTIVGSRIMRELDVWTGLLPRITATAFGVGRSFDAASRTAFRVGMDRRIRSFHDYLHDALHCDDVYACAAAALTGPLAATPLLTIFGERNDPFGFQQRWKELFPDAQQVVIPGGNHFPMCDAPDFAADIIRSWHRERVANLVHS